MCSVFKNIFIFEILGCAVLANKIRKLSEKKMFLYILFVHDRCVEMCFSTPESTN